MFFQTLFVRIRKINNLFFFLLQLKSIHLFQYNNYLGLECYCFSYLIFVLFKKISYEALLLRTDRKCYLQNKSGWNYHKLFYAVKGFNQTFWPKLPVKFQVSWWRASAFPEVPFFILFFFFLLLVLLKFSHLQRSCLYFSSNSANENVKL